MDREAWQVAVLGGLKGSDVTEQLTLSDAFIHKVLKQWLSHGKHYAYLAAPK